MCDSIHLYVSKMRSSSIGIPSGYCTDGELILVDQVDVRRVNAWKHEWVGICRYMSVLVRYRTLKSSAPRVVSLQITVQQRISLRCLHLFGAKVFRLLPCFPIHRRCNEVPHLPQHDQAG